MSKIIVAITGASGSIYGKRLVEILIQKFYQVDLIITDAGKKVVEQEIGLNLLSSQDDEQKLVLEYFGFSGEGKLRYLDINNLTADIASGSVKAEAMVIVPCTMSTVSAIATGRSDNLLERAADVILKEKRRLILVPRETPLNVIHLRNMLTLAEMQVDIVPAMPAFYHKPQSIDELINFVVGRILNLLTIEHDLFTPWKGEAKF